MISQYNFGQHEKSRSKKNLRDYSKNNFIKLNFTVANVQYKTEQTIPKLGTIYNLGLDWNWVFNLISNLNIDASAKSQIGTSPYYWYTLLCPVLKKD